MFKLSFHNIILFTYGLGCVKLIITILFSFYIFPSKVPHLEKLFIKCHFKLINNYNYHNLEIHVEIITDNKPNYSHQGLIIVICENTKMLDKYNMLNVRAFGKVAAILKNVVTSTFCSREIKHQLSKQYILSINQNNV